MWLRQAPVEVAAYDGAVELKDGRNNDFQIASESTLLANGKLVSGGMNSDDSTTWRSGCPLNIALEIIGDRWSLLILRDLMLKQLTTFKQFQESGEGIATNVLTDRLKRLTDAGLIKSARSPDDGRVITYSPTDQGLDLLPTMIEMILWAARHEETAAPPKIISRIQRDRDGFIREVRERFRHPKGKSR